MDNHAQLTAPEIYLKSIQQWEKDITIPLAGLIQLRVSLLLTTSLTGHKRTLQSTGSDSAWARYARRLSVVARGADRESGHPHAALPWSVSLGSRRRQNIDVFAAICRRYRPLSAGGWTTSRQLTDPKRPTTSQGRQ